MGFFCEVDGSDDIVMDAEPSEAVGAPRGYRRGVGRREPDQQMVSISGAACRVLGADKAGEIVNEDNRRAKIHLVPTKGVGASGADTKADAGADARSPRVTISRTPGEVSEELGCSFGEMGHSSRTRAARRTGGR